MKKTKRHGLMLLLACLVFPLAAQQQFTLEDLNFGGKNYRNMIPQNRSLTWWGDQLIHFSGRGDTCWTVNPVTGKEKLLFTLERLGKRAGLTGDSERIVSVVSFPYPDQPLALAHNAQNERLLIDFKKGKVVWRQPLEGYQDSEWNKQSRANAYVKDDNLYVTDGSGNTRQVTTDGSRDLVYGQSVHRNEFGIEGGLFWNPQGTRLAFYRMDQSMVTDYPLITVPELDDSTQVIATPAPEKYPMAGQTSHLVWVGVLDVATGDTVYLKAGDPTDRYFSNISWNPDGDIVYMMEGNRDQNEVDLVAYDAVTGNRLNSLYHESHPKYVEPQHPITFLPWNKEQFLLWSEKDGYNHLYLYDTSGNEVCQLTRGEWVVMDLLGFDEQEKAVIISANAESPIQQNLYRVDVTTGDMTLVDEGCNGWHTGRLSASGHYLIDSYQEPEVARFISIIDTRTGEDMRYFTAPDPWEGYAVPDYRCGTIKAADGVTDLYYRLVLPPDFDESKKYPTVVYVYGGPHAHNVDARWHWGSRSWETYMAQRGYVLFILDNRGSENRGRDFEQATFRQLGQVEMQDQMCGVDFLKTLSYVDTTRLGVHGWSFGGFMTISLMTNYPDVFKVGVAGGPVIDWKWYEVMYGERYMDTPQTNPEGYAKTSLLSKAADLKGRLQIIIGLNDPTVVPQHAYSFLKACIAAGTQPDFYVYPGQGHNMMGHQSVHLHERITRYFDDYLKK
ncbi:MAG: DPP IV N-terminal domain-containing protein [Muribaculaceae bacterium]|nr:DPP IV N-terminal domain-containing protein [Muribaculaceae bacterium]MBQ7204461.1 DPP IV N-terminal domain-containing protein [Muribaculaceae bacterium]